MASSSITIAVDTRRTYYSCYRPIPLKCILYDNDVAYLRGELLIESSYGSGVFVSTGAVANAYTTSNWPGSYDFNIMELCRNYVGQANLPTKAWSTYLLPGYNETNRFKFDVWPIRYSPSAVGQTYEDNSVSVQSMEFIGTPANLHHDESSSPFYGHNACDDYVLGAGNYYSPNVRPLTKCPTNQSRAASKGHHIHQFDQYGDSIYTYWSKDKDNTSCYAVIIQYAAGDDVVTGATIFEITKLEQKIRIPVHPQALSLYISLVTGSPYYDIIDASGALICKKISIMAISGTNPFGGATSWWKSVNSFTGAVSPNWRYIHYSDEANGDGTPNISMGNCGRRTKFVWQNELGAYDWFNVFGTHSKTVSLSGTQYDKVGKMGESYMSDNHQRTWLNTDREDIFKVISQPLSKSEADWLSGLYSSTKVWVQEEYKHAMHKDPRGNYHLIPVILQPNTFEIYSTDNSVFFLEFTYAYSERKTNPKG